MDNFVNVLTKKNLNQKLKPSKAFPLSGKLKTDVIPHKAMID